MKYRWEPTSININYHAINTKNEQLLLDQVTEILYSYFCQLERDQHPTETTVAASFNQGRTGTDG